MASQPHPIGAVCRLEGDRRYKEPRLVRILDNRNHPLYFAAIGPANASQAPNQYDTKAEKAAVTHSKLTLV